MFDDEPAVGQPQPYALGDELVRFSIEELQDLLGRLAAERSRVEAEITKKSEVMSAADSVFR